MTPVSSRAGDGLDVRAWLQRPGVRLLAVEFYATWCKPCMKAVPRWRELHERYRDQGLRLVVVATRDPSGQCVNPGWNPDDIICDTEGNLANAMRVGDALPAAFLWSWRGHLLVRRGHVSEVETALKRELASLPTVALVPPTKRNKTLVVLGRLLRNELAKTRKLRVVAGPEERKALRALKKRSHGMAYSSTGRCKLGEEIAANTLLKTNLLKLGRQQRLTLSLLSAEKGCLTASASVNWSKKHPETSVAEAVEELLQALKVPVEMPGARPRAKRAVPPTRARLKEGKIGSISEDDWDPTQGRRARVVIAFSSRPTGAVVMVDGKLVCPATPCKEEVEAGSHLVSMQVKRYKPREERKILAAGKALTWSLKPSFALVEILTQPSGATIAIDGKEVGQAPLTGLQLEPGPHKVMVADRCYKKVGKGVIVKAGEARTVTVTTRSLPSAIDVSCRDARGRAVAAAVWVDGRKVGKTPGVFKVPLCAKRVEIRHRKLGTWTQALNLVAKRVERIIARFETSTTPAAKPKPAVAPTLAVQIPEGSGPAVARKRYLAAMSSSKKRRYERAAILYHAAYKAQPKAIFLFLAGKDEFLAGHCTKAHETLRTYLTAPGSSTQSKGRRRAREIMNHCVRRGVKATVASDSKGASPVVSRKFFIGAVAATRGGNHQRAASLYHSAYKAQPMARFLFLAGEAEFEAMLCTKASKTLATYLAQPGSKTQTKQRDRALKIINRCKKNQRRVLTQPTARRHVEPKKSNPVSPRARQYYFKGIDLLDRGIPMRAIPLFKKAVSGGEVGGHAQLAKAYDQLGHKGNCRFHAKLYLEKRGNAANADSVRELLAKCSR
jgi:thiol-disulfide isomerase/thioredoxin/tetratricopeptide (TPR) repeat protein